MPSPRSPGGGHATRARSPTRSCAGVVFAPFHYGYFDAPGGSRPAQAPSAANEATRTEWDPVSKQPVFKVTAVRVTKLADGSSS
jgi:hypothetical protein